jgi:hypothetical protein
MHKIYAKNTIGGISMLIMIPFLGGCADSFLHYRLFNTTYATGRECFQLICRIISAPTELYRRKFKINL